MKKNTTVTVAEATKKLEHYCAYQERCHQEVVQKLKSLNMIPQAIDHIVAHLISHDYLNEERFARSFARGKFNQKAWGKNRIIRELQLRQISKFNIKAALSEIDETQYLEKLNELAQKRWALLPEKNSYKKKKKVADYLFYRGWEPSLVYEKINELSR